MHRPIRLRDARRYVAEHHRHNLPPRGHLASIAAYDDGRMCGVAILGRPVGRGMDDGLTSEVLRVCTDGTRNACSFLYARARDLRRALGYQRGVTYTLQSEPGSSLRAAGYVVDCVLDARVSWDTPSRPRVQVDLFGNERRPPEAKVRWLDERPAADPCAGAARRTLGLEDDPISVAPAHEGCFPTSHTCPPIQEKAAAPGFRRDSQAKRAGRKGEPEALTRLAELDPPAPDPGWVDEWEWRYRRLDAIHRITQQRENP